LIYEIPLPVKDPKIVKEVIKVLICHIASKMNTKVDRLHTLVGQPKIVPSYEELNKSLQEWYRERNIKRRTEGSSEGSKKKARVNMIKATDAKETTRYEDDWVHDRKSRRNSQKTERSEDMAH
jgi:hypothetical protein